MQIRGIFLYVFLCCCFSQHVVVAISGIVAYLIPDLPRDVKEKAYVEEKMLAERTQQFRLKKLHSNASD
jgi:hypothetical protein